MHFARYASLKRETVGNIIFKHLQTLYFENMETEAEIRRIAPPIRRCANHRDASDTAANEPRQAERWGSRDLYNAFGFLSGRNELFNAVSFGVSKPDEFSASFKEDEIVSSRKEISK